MSRDSTWLSYDTATQRLTLALRVQPNARKNEIVGLHGGLLKIKITAPAVDNRANAALIDFLSESLHVPRSAIIIRRGATGRRKVVEVAGGERLARQLEALVESRITNHDSRITRLTSK